MKKFLMAFSLAAVLVAATTSSIAKDEKSSVAKFRPALVSRKGYWVIEETKYKKQVVVLYYNNENSLVRKEVRTKKKADTSKAKVMRSLKRSLEEAIDWAEPL